MQARAPLLLLLLHNLAPPAAPCAGSCMALPSLSHPALSAHHPPCPSLLCPAQVGIVLSHSPELTRGRRWLSGKVITACFACSDLFALV